jgi:hypothetical protein
MKNRIRNKNRVGGMQSAGAATEVNASQANSLSKDTPFSSPNFHFLALTSPYILIGFFVLNTIFNQNIKGIVYVIGIIVLYVISNMISFILPINNEEICNLIGRPESIINPYFGTMVYGYTFSYLFVPMLYTSLINYSVLLSLMLILVVDVVIKKNINCLKIPQFILFLSVSFGFGILYVFLIRSINSKLLYHEDYTSDKQVCSIPSEQKFKCNVYKNGELITETTA